MIETSRLRIIPLNHEQLDLYLQAGGRLEKLFKLRDTGRTVAADVREMVSNFTLPKMASATNDNYLFYTFWIVIESLTQSIVAELGFKGEPGQNGEVEIGYGTMPNSRGRGFMTEAVGGMIDWARSQHGIKQLLAGTDPQNTASIKVIQKNQFTLLEKKDDLLWWKIDLK